MKISFDTIKNMANRSNHLKENKICEDAGLITLGELQAWLTCCRPSEMIQFHDNTHPGTFNCYQEYPRFLALDKTPAVCYVRDLLEEVSLALQVTYEDEKGNSHKMSRMTPLWVSNYGESSGIGLSGVDCILGTGVFLRTKQVSK